MRRPANAGREKNDGTVSRAFAYVMVRKLRSPGGIPVNCQDFVTRTKLVGLVARWMLAQRARHVDPFIALRYE
jgi:hypothetical protein